MKNLRVSEYGVIDLSSRVTLGSRIKKFLVGAEIAIPGNARSNRLCRNAGDQRAIRKSTVNQASGRDHRSRAKARTGEQMHAPTDPYLIAKHNFFWRFRLGRDHQVMPGPACNEDV